jgi:hypothetical protein
MGWVNEGWAVREFLSSWRVRRGKNLHWKGHIRSRISGAMREAENLSPAGRFEIGLAAPGVEPRSRWKEKSADAVPASRSFLMDQKITAG